MKDVTGKRVLVVGLARSGLAAARALAARGAVVTVTDERPPTAFQAEILDLATRKVGLELGVHERATFLRQDFIVSSPGVPWDMPHLGAARESRIPVYSEIEVASWFLEQPILAITGTNGKTTTTALTGKMLEASGFPVFVGGNIGVPLFSAADNVPRPELIVAEVSSFQLEGIQSFRPRVAALLNISGNHLDRHVSLEAYIAAKSRIFENQTPEDVAVLNADDPAVLNLAPGLKARKLYFTRLKDLPDGVLLKGDRILYRTHNLERVLMEKGDVQLRGAFNLENVMAAAAAACAVGAEFDALRRAVREFRGVEHRLEHVRTVGGVEYFNDSKATSVDATVKALTAFDRGVHLILGGKDKGSPYAPLRPLLKNRVREVLLIGAAADKIERELAGMAPMVRAGDLEDAVRWASASAEPGDVVLLAPACASYDQFRDFEQRGEVFKQIVSRLAGHAAQPADGPSAAPRAAEAAAGESRPGEVSLAKPDGGGTPPRGPDPASTAGENPTQKPNG